MDLDDLEIIVGTYEEFLLGYQVLEQGNENYDLAQSFATHSHRASIRSLAAGGKFVASGGSDESIFLYDMTTRKEVGLLMQHHGTISCLEFAPNGTHLLSGSEDGSIGASRTGNWQLEKLWGKAHKGSAVSSVSIHPSGKLFLSVGVDGTVRTWNFVKGRPAYTTHLCKLKDGRSVTQVLWSPNGETYSVLIGNRVEVFSVTGASIVYTIQLDTKITCISYVNSDVLCVASEDGRVFLYNIEEKTVIGQFQAHEGRVRCLMSFKLDYVVSASSAGQIKLWCIKDPKKVLELCEMSTGCRITCMTLVNIKSSSENAQVRLLKQCKAGMKMNLDAEFDVKLKQRPKNLGVVTVEVDAPKVEDGTSVEEENIKIKKEKIRPKIKQEKIKRKKEKTSAEDGTSVKSHTTDSTLTCDTNEKKKKKKKEKQSGVTVPLHGERYVDKDDVPSKNSTLNTKTKKKKSQRIQEVRNEMISKKDRTAKTKMKRHVSEEVVVMSVDQEGKTKKSKLSPSTVIKDKNLKRKRKEPLTEEAIVMPITTKQQRGEKRSGENKLKKSKKQKTVSSCDSIDSPSGKWIAE